jgi:hypothetical protein
MVQQKLACGNRGFLAQNGKSTFKSSTIKIEVRSGDN